MLLPTPSCQCIRKPQRQAWTGAGTGTGTGTETWIWKQFVLPEPDPFKGLMVHSPLRRKIIALLTEERETQLFLFCRLSPYKRVHKNNITKHQELLKNMGLDRPFNEVMGWNKNRKKQKRWVVAGKGKGVKRARVEGQDEEDDKENKKENDKDEEEEENVQPACKPRTQCALVGPSCPAPKEWVVKAKSLEDAALGLAWCKLVKEWYTREEGKGYTKRRVPEAPPVIPNTTGNPVLPKPNSNSIPIMPSTLNPDQVPSANRALSESLVANPAIPRATPAAKDVDIAPPVAAPIISATAAGTNHTNIRTDPAPSLRTPARSRTNEEVIGSCRHYPHCYYSCREARSKVLDDPNPDEDEELDFKAREDDVMDWEEVYIRKDLLWEYHQISEKKGPNQPD
ncbi:hypothetical protein B0H19DRAFT_1268382 [Mycena capillaripes]|nr:hypothetical protein B0H19DRAFT_1268382 [Mycena capillaripes]